MLKLTKAVQKGWRNSWKMDGKSFILICSDSSWVCQKEKAYKARYHYMYTQQFSYCGSRWLFQIRPSLSHIPLQILVGVTEGYFVVVKYYKAFHIALLVDPAHWSCGGVARSAMGVPYYATRKPQNQRKAYCGVCGYRIFQLRELGWSH